ncbi:MAG: type II secretion system inner membrane protein GspF [Puniceicoccales bacterium]|jgi:type IV pilus assembly protein PilC|nr:type II secretion system inner membrane protein GspF [Puniceicoccales bacterium]
MAKFKYTAIDSQGKQVSGRIDAPSDEKARAKLTSQRLMVTSLASEGGASAAAKASGGGKAKKKGFSFGGKVSKETIAVFTRQLATLLQAGLPLLRALEILQKQEKLPALKSALANICENVQTGNNLSDAMSQHPKMFDRLFVNMVRAGEAGGVLDTVLDRLAMFMEKSVKIQKKVKSAMVYPAVVVTVAIIIVYVLMVKVVPAFQKMLDGQKGASMPKLTEIVVGISDLLVEYWYVTPVAVIGVYVIVKAWLSSRTGKKIFDSMIFRIPKIGPFVTIVSVSRFARTFGTLMASGVPILQALTITRDTMSNVVLADSLSQVHDRVRDGESLSVPLEQTKVFPAMVTSMIQVGEETGQLPEMLNRVANNYDEEVDNAVGAMTSIIEPLLIVFLAVVVGTIVIAMFLPLIELIKKMTGG